MKSFAKCHVSRAFIILRALKRVRLFIPPSSCEKDPRCIRNETGNITVQSGPGDHDLHHCDGDDVDDDDDDDDAGPYLPVMMILISK